MAARPRLFWLLGLILLAEVGASGCLDQSSSSAYELPAAPAAVPTDLKAKIDDLVDYTLNQRLMGVKDQAAWQIVHGLEAYGRALPLAHDGQVSSALDYLMAGGACRGWVLRPGDKGVLSVSDPGSKTGQGHPDQWIGYLSQCGDVKLDDPMVVGGKTYQVRDLLTQAQWDLYDGMEASWTLMAAVTYLPLNAEWTSKDGQRWTIERIAGMEAATKPGTGGCGDTHRMYALAIAVNRAARESGKKPEQLTGGWKAAYDRVKKTVKIVRDYQQPDGSFSTSFFDRPASSPDLGTELYSGGHTLEFLTVALSPDELSAEWVTNGVQRLCQQLDELRHLEPDCGALYHAAHGLQLYRNVRFGVRKPVLATAAANGSK